MLAPIITKDMKLFPTRPLPSHIKNVRSRAQSLDQVSALQKAGCINCRVVPVRPRSSQSTGNLPSSVTRSPPSGSARKTTLSSIQEGVELSDRVDASCSLNSLDSSSKNGLSGPVKKMTPSQAAKIDAAKKSKLSTGSSSDSASDDGSERKENKKRKSVVKWITSAFRKSSKEDDSENMSTISS